MKTITIYKDAAHEAEMTAKIDYCKEKLQKAVEVYGELELPEITDFEAFLRNSVAYARQQWQKSVEVPPGLNRDKYLELLEKPDFVAIGRQLDGFDLKIPELWTYESGTVKVCQRAADELAKSNNIEVVEGSAEHKFYEDVKILCESLNAVNQRTGIVGNFVNTNWDKLFSKDEAATAQAGHWQFKLDPRKLKQYTK